MGMHSREKFSLMKTSDNIRVLFMFKANKKKKQRLKRLTQIFYMFCVVVLFHNSLVSIVQHKKKRNIFK